MILFMWTEIKICVYYRLCLQSSSYGLSLKLNQIPSSAKSQRTASPSCLIGLKTCCLTVPTFTIRFSALACLGSDVYLRRILIFCPDLMYCSKVTKRVAFHARRESRPALRDSRSARIIDEQCLT